MHRHDVRALNRALSAYRKLSPHARAEAAELQLRCGWRAAAIHAARKCQAIALGLPSGTLTPCELKAEKIGGLGPEIWLADIDDIDQHRWLTASTLRRLLQLGLSRFEPSPLRAIELAEAHRRELGTATEPSGGAA